MSTVETPTTYAQQLLTIANDALAHTSGGSIDRAFVSPPGVPFDCEMLVVVESALARYVPARGGALDAGHVHRWASLWIHGWQILIVRDCMPITLNEHTADPPSAAQYAAAAAETKQDVWAVMNALEVAAENGIFQGRCSEFFVDGAIALDMQGQRGGWAINVRATIDGYVPGS